MNPEIPFFFVTGDEYFWEKLDTKTIQEYLGKPSVKQDVIVSENLWK